VIKELEMYKGNVSFVSIAGMFRTGKSFLINKLLNLKGRGFKVAPTVDTCTKGLWIWSCPVYNERENMYIFFLDCEGSGSTA